MVFFSSSAPRGAVIKVDDPFCDTPSVVSTDSDTEEVPPSHHRIGKVNANNHNHTTALPSLTSILSTSTSRYNTTATRGTTATRPSLETLVGFVDSDADSDAPSSGVHHDQRRGRIEGGLPPKQQTTLAVPLLLLQDEDVAVTGEKKKTNTVTETSEDGETAKYQSLLDPSKHDEVPELRDIRAEGTILSGVVQAWALMNAIATIMALVNTIKQRVNPYNDDYFRVASQVMIYAPLVFSFLLYLPINNYFSARMYYYMLRRGILLYFPDNAKGFWYAVTHVAPAIFYSLIISYTVFVCYVSIRYGAGYGDILVVVSNIGIGLAMLWRDQQTIDDQLMSANELVKAFIATPLAALPTEAQQRYIDFKGDDSALEDARRRRIGEYFRHVTLVEAESASSMGAQRDRLWASKKVPMWQRVLVHLGTLAAVIGFGGLVFYYFYVQDSMDLADRWDRMINPCISACAAGMSDVNGTAGTKNQTRSVPFCKFCVCACYQQLQQKDDVTTGACKDNINPPPFHGFDVCPSPITGICPANCKWLPGWLDS